MDSTLGVMLGLCCGIAIYVYEIRKEVSGLRKDIGKLRDELSDIDSKLDDIGWINDNVNALCDAVIDKELPKYH